MAQEFAGTSRLSTADFGYGLRKAVLYPWEAVSDPREGTILTVLRDWGDAVHRWSDRTQDFVDLFFRARHAACRSLQATTAQLSPLRQAGVVDAGAQGLVHMLTGVTRFLANGTIREADHELFEAPTDDVTAEVVEDPRFRYCTQFVIEGSDLDTRALRGELSSLGDSLIVAGSPTRAKIHIHSNTPARAFHTVDQHGRIVVQRIEDMSAQFRAAHTAHRDIALVVDSSCDLPQEVWDRYTIHMVPCQLILEGRTYLDKLSITPEDLSALQRATRSHPTTSQPTPADFKARYEFLLRHYRSVLSLSLSGTISGTLDAARAGAKLAGGNVTVLDTRSTSVGLGLMARAAAEAIECGASLEETIGLVQGLIGRVRIHITVPSLDALVRSGRVSRMKGLAANLLGLKPLIKLNADTDGKPVHGSTVFGVRGGRRKILQILHQEIGDARPVEFAITHANAPEDAQWFKERIEREFNLAREPFVVPVTSVLAAHIGEGASGLAYILPASGRAAPSP